MPDQQPEGFDPGAGPTIFTQDENDNVVTLSGNIPQDILDQIGGGAGTTIEDLLPPAADGGTTVADMNFTERFERQSELADADPTGRARRRVRFCRTDRLLIH